MTEEEKELNHILDRIEKQHTIKVSTDDKQPMKFWK